MFDTAEAYASGQSEVEMQVPAVLDVGFWLPMLTYISRGRVIKELGLRRTDLVISTKIFWGLRKGPNDGGLSRKQCVAGSTDSQISISTEQTKLFSIIEGTQEALARLGLDYVDIVFAHRHDHNGMSRPLLP